MGISFGHILLVLIIVFVLFGAGKLPQVMSELARGLKAFKKGIDETDNADSILQPTLNAMEKKLDDQIDQVSSPAKKDIEQAKKNIEKNAKPIKKAVKKAATAVKKDLTDTTKPQKATVAASSTQATKSKKKAPTSKTSNSKKPSRPTAAKKPK